MKTFTCVAVMFSLFLFYCTAQSIDSSSAVVGPAAPAAQFPEGNAYQNAALTYIIIDAPNSTFGYDVLMDGKLMIHQTSIPAMPGNDGFRSKDDAAKVAELVMHKIRHGEMPPTVTTEELKSLRVINQ